MASAISARWGGEYRFLLGNLLLKDFRIRYRNMSLGIGWSVANPLIMMGVLTFIFTRVLKSDQPNFPVFVLCGLVPYNFFAVGWLTGTMSIVDNSHLVKRVRFPREVIPVSAVLSSCVHFGIQLALLLVIAGVTGVAPNQHWPWLPIVAAFEVIFVCGIALIFSAINVYVRDTRYLVDAATTVLFWLVPIFYSFTIIPEQYHEVYRINPVAAVVMAFRNVLLEGRAPADSLMIRLAAVSLVTLGAGFVVFGRLKHRFYDSL
jgi:ABC-type polysaccharide/polyol phosphate export permease